MISKKAIWLFILFVVLTTAGLADASRILAEPDAQVGFHTVEDGDTWRSIAALYRTPVSQLWRSNGVTNPALLQAGQRLLIPTTSATAAPDVTGYTTTAGQSFWLAAIQSGVSASEILIINGLDSPTEAVGQQIFAPNNQGGVAQIPVPPTPLPTPVVETPPTEPQPTEITITGAEGSLPIVRDAPLQRSLMGIQGHFSIPDDDRDAMLRMAKQAGFTWLKYQVDWSNTEYSPGKYSIELDKLDIFMHHARTKKFNILLSIAKAPDWARNTQEEDGPPVDYGAYNEFVKFIVLRYKQDIAAIEIWNEPNLGREWRGAELSGHEYVRLLAGAYDTIKSVYPEGNIVVISAGPAPTGINDGVDAVDDRVFLRQMYEAGLPQYADAVGVHPYSWANPPWIRCCGSPDGPPIYNDHPSFFFLNTIEDYRAIQAEYDDLDRQLWATEFGWGTTDGLGFPVPEEAPYFAYISGDQQARYIHDAFVMAQAWDFMGPMFLWNLNVAALRNFDNNQAAYSIVSGIYQPRAAYNVLKDAPKVDD